MFSFFASLLFDFIGVFGIEAYLFFVEEKKLLSEYLRLFVVDENYPAINLYKKTGFEKVDGIYDEVINNDFVLHEFGFEIKTSL